ncbi:MAG TPA: hypothetical protein VIK86_08095 [Candidatus Paceibacterota bacterium]
MKIKGTDISMVRGDSEIITVSCMNSNGINVPLITGDIIYFTIKTNINTSAKILQKIITAFVNGTAIIDISHDDTKDLRFCELKYDVQLTRADGTVTTIIPPSKFSIIGEVTYE